MSPQQTAAQEAARVIAKVNQIILFPLIMLMMGVALLFFLWGCAQMIFNADDAKAREQGKKHIFWGILGMVIMVSAYGILSIAANTFGLKGTLDCAANPNAPNCTNLFKPQ